MALYQLSAFLSQSFWIPKPPLTSANLHDLTDHVCMITGGYAGVGLALSTILYAHNATVYIAGRSFKSASNAIDTVTSAHPSSNGKLHFLQLDLSDLTTIKSAVDQFLQRETKLHWLNNNAGIMHPPPNSVSAQGHDLQFATNILGPFLLSKLLQPTLRATAATSPPNTVRVTWAGSLATVLGTPTGGVAWTADGKDFVSAGEPVAGYAITKAANYLLAVEFGKRFGNDDGVLHVAYNPGNLSSSLSRNNNPWGPLAIVAMLLNFPAEYGAYTELYAGLSPDMTLEKDQGGWIVPWGRRYAMRVDILAEAQKEKGTAWKTFEFCDAMSKDFQ